MNEDKVFIVTLVQELSGYAIRAEAPDHITLRRYLNKRFGYLWCSVYPLEDWNKSSRCTEQIIGQTLTSDKILDYFETEARYATVKDLEEED